jgi:hypothetical protein
MKKITSILFIFFFSFVFSLSAEVTEFPPTKKEISQNNISEFSWKTYQHKRPSGLFCYFDLPTTALFDYDEEDDYVDEMIFDHANHSHYAIDITEMDEEDALLWRDLSYSESLVFTVLLDLTVVDSQETVTDQGYPAVDITLSNDNMSKHVKIRKIKLDDDTLVSLRTLYRSNNDFFHQHLIDSFHVEQEETVLELEVI